MKIIVSILFILLAVGIFSTEINAGNQCRSETGGYCLKLSEITTSGEKTTNTGLAQVPGLEFLNLTADAKIGDILAQLYIFGVWLVGISALVVLVFAGVWYMTAGDNQTRVGQARTWMGNAIFGLVLALISFLILYTINPSLTNTLSLNLDKLKSGGGSPGGEPPGGELTGFCFSPDQNFCSFVTCTFSPDSCAGNTQCKKKEDCPK